MDTFSEKIKEINAELANMTLGEFEHKHGITAYDYTGVGFGYHLKTNRPATVEEAKLDSKTPTLDALMDMANEL
jgi:hypothetical protein